MTKKKAEEEKEAAPLHETGLTMFDLALDAAGLDPRGEGETAEAYVDRDDWGPNTKRNLTAALEAARSLDRTQTIDSVQAARQHHDDPNPPDTPTLKK